MTLAKERSNSVTLDHIVPISRGGTEHKANVRLACLKCNQSKGSNDPPTEAWQGSKMNASWKLRKPNVA